MQFPLLGAILKLKSDPVMYCMAHFHWTIVLMPFMCIFNLMFEKNSVISTVSHQIMQIFGESERIYLQFWLPIFRRDE